MLFEGQEFLEDGWFRDDKALDWKKRETFQGINRLYRDLIHLRRNLYGNTAACSALSSEVHHVNDKTKSSPFIAGPKAGPRMMSSSSLPSATVRSKRLSDRPASAREAGPSVLIRTGKATVPTFTTSATWTETLWPKMRNATTVITAASLLFLPTDS